MIRLGLQKKETEYLRMKRAKLNKSHFKKIKTIGLGAFGEVSLVCSINNESGKRPNLYAMKKLKKSHVVAKNQVAHVIAEKDILAEADNEWIVKLYYSFQVSNHREIPPFLCTHWCYLRTRKISTLSWNMCLEETL